MPAWTVRYRFTTPIVGREGDEPRICYAVGSIKTTLVLHGYGALNKHSTGYGVKCRDMVKAFQAAHNLKADGEVGRTTAAALWRPLLVDAANAWTIPLSDLCGLVAWESADDPAAYHDNANGSRDRGLAQVNNQAHPDISDAAAYHAATAIDYAAHGLRIKHDGFLKASVDPWILAIAAWHNPSEASQWAKTGTPPEPQPGAVRIDLYVERVRAACPEEA